MPGKLGRPGNAMRNRDQSYRYVDPAGDFAVNVSHGPKSRSFELSRAKLAAGALFVGALSLATIAAAGYLAFRDDMLASLLDRQTQMQYAYEDRLAALRLRLDQVTSWQFIDQDGVEGKVQSLVLRQAQLETRAAVVAQLVERTVARDTGVTLISQTKNDALGREARGAGKVAKGVGVGGNLRSNRRGGGDCGAAPCAGRARRHIHERRRQAGAGGHGSAARTRAGRQTATPVAAHRRSAARRS